MNFWDRFVGFFSARQRFERARFDSASRLMRKYEGAGAGRRFKNWKTPSTSASAEVQTSLAILRNRARALVRDNPYAARAVQAITANVVGWGILGQVKIQPAQNNKSGVNKTLQSQSDSLSNLWNSWADSRAADFDGRHTLYGLQRLVKRSLVESGEVLIRRRRVGRRTVIGADGFPVEVPPLALQVLEGDFLPITSHWMVPADPKNIVIDGIEFDPDGKRVAYHIYEEHPGNGFNLLSPSSSKTSFKTVRVPAEDILHLYRVDRPGQTRGVTWFAPVMLRMRDFDEYEDAQLVRQKIAAMFAVFIKDMDGTDPSLTGAGGETELGEKVEPGIIELLPPGKDISLAVPPALLGYHEYGSFVLHAIASGLGITYETLTGDLSQVNFSSARMGFLEMNRNVEEWREDIMLAQFLNPAFEWWKDSASLLGAPVERAQMFWTAPAREMVDPSKETEAMKNAVRSGFMTLSEAIRSRGQDPERFFSELASDNKKLDSLGIILDTDPRNDPKRLAALNGQGAGDGSGDGGQNPPDQNAG